jgi:hypothetical protein
MSSFKIDENLPVEFAKMLEVRGHDALTVNDQKWAAGPIQIWQKFVSERNGR